MAWIGALFGMTLLSVAGSSASATTKAPQVRTDAGTVEGIAYGTLDRYLGIPYAQPPVGDLRWRDPVRVKAWPGVRPTKSFSASCYQKAGQPWGPFSREFLDVGQVSEDCLYLNVWAPKRSAKPLPVFFFIHGGGFGSGSASVPVYEGSDLARHGAVVVTINYRLGGSCQSKCTGW